MRRQVLHIVYSISDLSKQLALRNIEDFCSEYHTGDVWLGASGTIEFEISMDAEKAKAVAPPTRLELEARRIVGPLRRICAFAF